LNDNSSLAPRHELLKASNSGMHGSNRCSNFTAKSSHGSQGPLMDQGQMVRKNSREQVGNASNFVMPGSKNSHSLDVKPRHDSGNHGSNHYSSFSAKSSHGSRGPVIGQMVRKNSCKQVGNVSSFVAHSSHHSCSLNVKSRHDSQMYGSNHYSSFNSKSSHGSQGPMIDHEQIVRKHT
jgi:hypothetical protein